MLRTLLIRGLLAGLIAGLVGFGYARLAGEPPLARAIAFEETVSQAGRAQAEVADADHALEHAHEAGGHAHDHGAAVPVSRATQRGAGLLLGTTVLGIVLGGTFALAFAVVYGRVGQAPPLTTALWLAVAAFVVVFLVPFAKYPSNPPAVGDPATIQQRTTLYFAMIVASVLSAVASIQVYAQLARTRRLRSYALASSVSTYVALILLAIVVLPGFDEVPAGFPATTLWEFRRSTVGLQLVMWGTIGLTFAVMARRAMTPSFRSASG